MAKVYVKFCLSSGESATAGVLSIVVAGCAVPGKQTTSLKVDEPWLKNPALSLGVLDVYANDNPIDPAFLQLHLTQALRELGYSEAELRDGMEKLRAGLAALER